MNNLITVKQGKKIFATSIVGTFFLFFWINGPLHFKEILAHLEVEETPFSKSKLVGKENKIENFKKVGKVETQGEGWSLITENTKKINTFKMLSSKDEKNSIEKKELKNLTKHVKKLFLTPIKIEGKSAELGSYLIVESKGENFLYLETQHNFNPIRGYGGPIQLGVLINPEGKIQRVQHISSKETVSYLDKIQKHGFYNKFIKIPLEKKHSIDAVSGATLTTEAIAKTTTSLIDLYHTKIEENYEDLNSSSFYIIAQNTLWWILYISVIGLLFIYGFQKKYKKSKRDIQILSFVSVIYIGFFMNNSFTYISFLHPFLGTSVSSLIALYSLFSLLGAIWGSNLYCKYVCPYGHLQRMVLNSSKNKFSKKFFISNKWIKRLRDGLAIILITGVLLGMRSWGNFEVFPDIFGLEFSSFWFGISLLLIVVNLRYPFIWCRIACPTGAVLDKINEITK